MNRVVKQLILAVFLGLWTYFVARFGYNLGNSYNPDDVYYFLLWMILLVCPVLLSVTIDWFYVKTSKPKLEKSLPKLPYPQLPMVIEKPVEVEKIVEKIIEKPAPREQGNIVINIEGKKITLNDSVYTE
jgi:hypothetical protein